MLTLPSLYINKFKFCETIESVSFGAKTSSLKGLVINGAALINGESVFFTRIKDVFMFKVPPKEKSLFRGLVGLNEDIIVENLKVD